MGSSNGQYPRDLRKVVAHAQRLIKVLAEIERGRKDAWFRGRAEEVRGAVSLAIGDWRSGARDADVAGRLLLSYVDSPSPERIKEAAVRSRPGVLRFRRRHHGRGAGRMEVCGDVRHHGRRHEPDGQ